MMQCIRTVGRDNARTPMQWDDSANAGFTSGTPWIMVNPNYTQINARAALADPNSVFYYYQKLIRLRHEHTVIAYGVFEPLLQENDSVYAFRRLLDNQVLIVACNWTDQDQPCTLFDEDPSVHPGAVPEELICNYSVHKTGVLQPYEARAVLYRAD